MPNVWVVRADGGKYTGHFLQGGYAGIGWNNLGDLTDVATAEQIRERYITNNSYQSTAVVGINAGQVRRFRLDIAAGDYVLTPATINNLLRYGRVAERPYYYEPDSPDGCRYDHRIRISWEEATIRRTQLSVPFQNSIRSALSVFQVRYAGEFLRVIGDSSAPPPRPPSADPNLVVLNHVLELNAEEFEILVSHLLAAMGFEDTEVVGRVGDGGVDVKGVMNASNVAKIDVFVQVKRYGLGSRVPTSVVKQLRTSIPFGGQGAFITTSDYQGTAPDVAQETGFARIGLINGRQLVDLLIQHWESIPEEFQGILGLKRGLVPS